MGYDPESEKEQQVPVEVEFYVFYDSLSRSSKSVNQHLCYSFHPKHHRKSLALHRSANKHLYFKIVTFSVAKDEV
jgi:hypothetical protein